MINNKSIEITKSQFDYLLPVLRKKLQKMVLSFNEEKYFFTGNSEEIKDMYARLAYLD